VRLSALKNASMDTMQISITESVASVQPTASSAQVPGSAHNVLLALHLQTVTVMLIICPIQSARSPTVRTA
jgi:hypothetical protein